MSILNTKLTKSRLLTGTVLIIAATMLVACGGSGGGSTPVVPPPPPPPPPTGVANDAKHAYAAGGDFGDVVGEVYPDYVRNSDETVSLTVTDITSSTTTAATTKSETEGAGCHINNAAEATESVNLEIGTSMVNTCTVKTTDAAANATNVLAETTIFFVDPTNPEIVYNPLNNLVFDIEASGQDETITGCGDDTLRDLNTGSSEGVTVTRMGSSVLQVGQHMGSSFCIIEASLTDNASSDFRKRLIIIGDNQNGSYQEIVSGYMLGESERGASRVGDSALYTEAGPSTGTGQFSIGNGRVSPGKRTFDTGHETLVLSGTYTDSDVSIPNAFVQKAYAQVNRLGGRQEWNFIFKVNPDGSSELSHFVPH